MLTHLPRTSSRRLSTTSFTIAILQLVGVLQAQTPPEPKAPYRALVKLRTSLARDVEAALPLPQLELAPGKSGNPRVEAFLSRHAAKKIKPLYPGLAREKKA